jgi:hypothetical protein
LGVKRLQTIHHRSVDVAHGLALLFGIGTKALVWSLPGSESLSFVIFLFDLKDRFFARPALRPGRRAVKVGRCTNLAACSAFIRPYLDRFEGDGTLTRSG